MTAIFTGRAVTNAEAVAIEARGGWLWAWAANDAGEFSWPHVSAIGGAAMRSDIGQRLLQKTEVQVEGVGSNRYGKAARIVGRRAGAPPNPVSTPFVGGWHRGPLGGPSGLPAVPAGQGGVVHARILFALELAGDIQAFNAGGPGTQRLISIFSLQHTTARLAIDVLHDDFRIACTGSLGAINAYVPDIVEAIAAQGWALADLFMDAGRGLLYLFVNGVDFGPLAGTPGASTITAFPDAAQPSIAVGATNGAIDVLPAANNAPADNSRFLFVGTAFNRVLSIEQHRSDLKLLGIETDAFAISAAPLDWTWAWSGHEIDTELGNWSGMTDYGGADATLAVSGLTADQPTTYLRKEGLGGDRLDRAIRGDSITFARRLYPSLFPGFAGDFHLRLILRDEFSVGTAEYFQIYDPGAVGFRLFRSGNDLTLDVHNGTYQVARDISALAGDWLLIDVFYERTGGAGGQTRARLVVNNGETIGADAGSTLAVIPADLNVRLLDGDSSGVELVFAGILDGITVNRLDATGAAGGRHRADACALEVVRLEDA